ncbi:unnamed protein product [Mytilus edulis]|uniref:Uncharacterized protein n=1 Tax=Mytilus edulis TaxID=6550 RepID=A0A8S3PXQ2_MYTED|nr:unnamed protein product [Mytilus edulis]
MDISEEIISFFAVILIEPNNLKKAILCIQAIGQRVSISKTLLDVLKDMLQGKTPTALVKMVCNVLSINTNLTEDIELLLNGCCSMKSALTSFITSLSKRIGISLDMVREIQHIIDGNMPECGIQIFVLNICIQISKSTILLKENHVTKFFEKLLPLAVASTEQVTNAISLGKQILNGAVPSAGIPLLIFLLRHISVGEDIISSIDDFLKEGDVDVLISWMSKKTNVHQSVLGKTLINDYSNRSIFDVILSTYSKEHDLHPAFKKI